jgi:hypothetical protein
MSIFPLPIKQMETPRPGGHLVHIVRPSYDFIQPLIDEVNEQLKFRKALRYVTPSVGCGGHAQSTYIVL